MKKENKIRRKKIRVKSRDCHRLQSTLSVNNDTIWEVHALKMYETILARFFCYNIVVVEKGDIVLVHNICNVRSRFILPKICVNEVGR